MTRVPCLLDGIYDYPLSGLSHPQADDQGPGAPTLRGAPAPEITASDARGGGLPERSPGQDAARNRGASDHPILKHARAC